MNRRELIDAWMRAEQFDSMLWDDWVEWRLRQAGYDRKTNPDNELWHNIVHGMPEHYTIDIRVSEGTVEFSYDAGVDTLSLTDVHAEEEMPDLKMLWHLNYYDGPLSGVAEYNGEMVYFDLVDEELHGNRKYALYRLTEKEKDQLIKQHRAFQQNVGRHTDHDPEEHSWKLIDGWMSFFKGICEKEDPLKLDEKLGEFYWHEFHQYSRPPR